MRLEGEPPPLTCSPKPASAPASRFSCCSYRWPRGSCSNTPHHTGKGHVRLDGLQAAGAHGRPKADRHDGARLVPERRQSSVAKLSWKKNPVMIHRRLFIILNSFLNFASQEPQGEMMARQLCCHAGVCCCRRLPGVREGTLGCRTPGSAGCSFHAGPNTLLQ